MTDSQYCAVCLLVDRSGSMMAIKDATEEAIDGYVREQAAAIDRRTTIRVCTFDVGAVTVLCPSTPAAEVPPFVLEPRGRTALLDAMGSTMVEFGEELAALEESRRPGHVIFAVMTDGCENASCEYTYEQIKAMVEHQEQAYGWNVVYLGANQDAIRVGARLGVRAGSTMTYNATREGTQSAVASVGDYTAAVASGGRGAFTEEQRRAAR